MHRKSLCQFIELIRQEVVAHPDKPALAAETGIGYPRLTMFGTGRIVWPTPDMLDKLAAHFYPLYAVTLGAENDTVAPLVIYSAGVTVPTLVLPEVAT